MKIFMKQFKIILSAALLKLKQCEGLQFLATSTMLLQGNFVHGSEGKHGCIKFSIFVLMTGTQTTAHHMTIVSNRQHIANLRE